MYVRTLNVCTYYEWEMMEPSRERQTDRLITFIDVSVFSWCYLLLLLIMIIMMFTMMIILVILVFHVMLIMIMMLSMFWMMWCDMMTLWCLWCVTHLMRHIVVVGAWMLYFFAIKWVSFLQNRVIMNLRDSILQNHTLYDIKQIPTSKF